MTSTHTVTLPAADSRPCPCGCAPSEDICCALGCLIQPRFFCGQLLTDQDLARLITWASNKARLTRYRHGWGVACGLEVRCDPQRAGVIVGPGYAVSCCGEDIIVCEDTPVDLSAGCQEEMDPCIRLRPDPSSERQPEGGNGRGSALDPFHPGGTAGEITTVDITIGYHTEKTAPVTALAGGACPGSAECDYGQLKETFKLTPQVTTDADPVRSAAAAWLKEYERCAEVITAFGRRFASLEGNGEAIRRWLIGWIDSHPLRQFCFVRDRICRLSADELASEAALVRALFWLVQDCRNAYVAGACHGCGAGHRVPLARVWLQQLRPDQEGGASCSVVQIDSVAPYRRALGPQYWPAPLGEINGARVLWHRWPEACTTLAGLGVQAADPAEFTMPATVAELGRALDCSPFLPCGEPVVPQVVDMAPYGQRVVGFCGVQEGAAREADGDTASATTPAVTAQPGVAASAPAPGAQEEPPAQATAGGGGGEKP
jgi:hypothetical protein